MSALGLLAPGCQTSADEFEAPVQVNQEAGKDMPEFDPSSVLVKFRDTPSISTLDSVLANVQGKIQDANRDGKDDRFAHLGKGTLAKLDLHGSLTALDAISKLKGHPAIEYVEPNYILHTTLQPNDPSFGDLWGLENSGQAGGVAGADISALEAWDVTVGSHEVIVGVIDTGVDYTHPDLAANVWVNPGEIAGNGIDDDGNGFVDDVHGINAIDGSGDPMDDNDHGTHVSGTIGAVGDNGVGVVGVNWDVTIVGLKFLSAAGSGTTAGAIACVDYAVDLKNNRGVDIRVLSNSWGGGGFSQALEDAIVAANDADILFVAAAGNSSSDNDSSPHYPSSYEVPNVVAVASTTRTDSMSSFSSFGATSVDLGAPGSDILSTTPGNTYSTFSGTSMATPHVSGAAALLLSVNNTLSATEIKDILMESGDPIAALAGRTVSGKRLNVASALEQVGPPGPSFRLAASPSSQSISQGESAAYTVDVTSVAGFTGTVNLSLEATPALNATVTFTPNPVPADSSATLSIATSSATVAGNYTLTISGTDGVATKSRTVYLSVRPEGTEVIPFPSDDTPIAIPDNDPAGITSTLNVPTSIAIFELAVEVNITHTFIGDLLITLTSPEGTTVTLHDRAGGGTDNLNQTFLPTEFFGQNAQGDWTLSVSDNAGIDVGTLDSWTLIVTGVPDGGGPGNERPTAAFSFTTGGLSATFVDGSTDTDGTIAGWSWDFGDGATSTEQHPTHAYAAAGTYNVALTVTDDAGATDTIAQDVTVQQDGTVTRTYESTDTPIDIPDRDPAGITSTIAVPDSLTLISGTVSVNITHTFIGDLIVTLTSPSGKNKVLHNRTGGSTDNLYATFDLDEFAGENTMGLWTLSVSDNAGLDLGTLDNWSLTLTGIPDIDLMVTRAIKRRNGSARVNLAWFGATTANIEIYRDSELVAITENDGQFQDQYVTDGTLAMYKVCEYGGQICSEQKVAIYVAPN